MNKKALGAKAVFIMVAVAGLLLAVIVYTGFWKDTTSVAGDFFSLGACNKKEVVTRIDQALKRGITNQALQLLEELDTCLDEENLDSKSEQIIVRAFSVFSRNFNVNNIADGKAYLRTFEEINNFIRKGILLGDLSIKDKIKQSYSKIIKEETANFETKVPSAQVNTAFSDLGNLNEEEINKLTLEKYFSLSKDGQTVSDILPEVIKLLNDIQEYESLGFARSDFQAEESKLKIYAGLEDEIDQFFYPSPDSSKKSFYDKAKRLVNLVDNGFSAWTVKYSIKTTPTNQDFRFGPTQSRESIVRIDSDTFHAKYDRSVAGGFFFHPTPDNEIITFSKAEFSYQKILEGDIFATEFVDFVTIYDDETLTKPRSTPRSILFPCIGEEVKRNNGYIIPFTLFVVDKNFAEPSQVDCNERLSQPPEQITEKDYLTIT